MSERSDRAAQKPGPEASLEEILIRDQRANASRWPKALLNWNHSDEARDWQVDHVESMLIQPLSDPKPLYQKP